jgi:hypothetical protein
MTRTGKNNEDNLKPSNCISGDGGVGASHVRRRIDVVQRRGENERVGSRRYLGVVRTSSMMAAAARGAVGGEGQGYRSRMEMVGQ